MVLAIGAEDLSGSRTGVRSCGMREVGEEGSRTNLRVRKQIVNTKPEPPAPNPKPGTAWP